jgi:ABC-2 type transport system permease protein
VNGLRILLRKELIESWRTYRLPIVGGLFLFVGLTSPVLAKYLPEIIKAAAGDQLPAIPFPPPVPTDAVDQLWKNLAQFGAFAAIILAMGSVATERERGTAAFVLTKTASRDGFLAAKALAIGLVLAFAVALAVTVGWIYTAILFEPLPIAGWAGLAGLAWLNLAAWAAITFLGSTVTGSVAAAAGVGFAAFLGLSLAAAIPNVGRLLPGGLAEPAIRLASGLPVEPGDVLVPAIATAILIGVALVASAAAFRRRVVAGVRQTTPRARNASISVGA